MQVKDILRDCLRKLNIADFLDEESFTATQTAQVDRLLNCLNIIYQEVASDAFPLTATENVVLDGNVLKYSELSNQVIKIISLKENGKQIEFVALPSGIESEFVGGATICYNHLPTQLTLNSTIDDFRLTSGMLSDGTVGEYYFLDSVFDLAAAFDTKFRKDLSWAVTKGREIKIKARRWGL